LGETSETVLPSTVMAPTLGTGATAAGGAAGSDSERTGAGD
jgi:hypothetical protein